MKNQEPVVPLDRHISDVIPAFATSDEVRSFESLPFEQRIAAQSTYQAIQLGAALNPQAPAIQMLAEADPDETPAIISYQQLQESITQSANLFHDLGVGANDVVSLLLPLMPQSFYALFGAQAAGIANPVNPLLEPHQLAEILSAADTSVVVALGPVPGTDIWTKLQRIAPQLPKLKAIVQVGGPLQPDAVDFNARLGAYPKDHLLSARDIIAADVAAYFHTGGTTGTPKLVRHTHGNQVYQAWVMNVMLPGPRPDSLLFGLPLFHVGGALTQALASFTRGASLVVLSPAGWRNPRAIGNVWRLVERYRPSSLSGVPTVLTAAIGIDPGDADLSSLTCSAGGGAAIPVSVGKKLQAKLGKPVVEVYGMTETASVHTLAYLSRELRLGSAGHAVPYSRVRIVKLDADGNFAGDCVADEIGVVAMAGPGVFSGYLNEAHNDDAFVEPGWVNSGDLGRLDAQGYLWITGRAKDLIIRGGHNIDPAGVEEVLYQHPAVALAAVVGQPDSYAGELPLAFVQLKPQAQVSCDELLDHVRAGTPERAAVPVDIVFLDTIPLTGVGKVFKPQLRWLAAQRVFTQALAPLTEQGVTYSVGVGAHGTHGSLALITVTNVAAAQRETLGGAIEQCLSPYVLAYEIAWEE